MRKPFLATAQSTGRDQLFVWSGIVTIALFGCRAEVPLGVSTEYGEGVDVGTRSANVLVHDFGFVSPGFQGSHQFTLTNASGADWTIREIHSPTSCSCLVLRHSPRVIRSGASAEIDVSYRAGDRSRNDQNRLIVEFANADTAPIHLIIRAKVREPLYCQPSHLEFRAGALAHDQQLLVCNYSRLPWRALEASAAESWVSAHTEPVPEPGSGRGLQAWRVTVLIRSDMLAPGTHSAALNLIAESESRIERLIPIEVHIPHWLQVSPERFFFGECHAGTEAKSSVTFRPTERFAGFAERPLCDLAAVSHDLRDRLTVRWIALPDSAWILEARLFPRSGDKLLSGVVTVSFPQSPDRKGSGQHTALPPIRLPVTALVR